MRRRSFSPAGWPAMGERGGLVEVDQGKGLAMVGRDDPWSACIHMRTQQRPDPLVRLLFRRLITFCFPATFQWESVRCKKTFTFPRQVINGAWAPSLAFGNKRSQSVSLPSSPSSCPHCHFRPFPHTGDPKMTRVGNGDGMRESFYEKKKLLRFSKTYINDQLSSIL